MENALKAIKKPTPPGLPAGNDHPIVDMPFSAIIGGRQFRGRGLSLVAAYVTGLVDPQVINTKRLVHLVFDFDGFAVTLVAEATLHETQTRAGEAELIFSDPAGSHLPQLRHILNAFIAGDLVSLGQTIGVAGTSAPKPPRAADANNGRSLRQTLQGGALVLLALALVGLAGGLIYQRSFVQLVPGPGLVVTTGETLRATTAGQIVFVDAAAPKGEVVMAIQSTSGEVLSLMMPCDCTVNSLGLRVGSTVLAGEPVAQLAAPDSRVVVSAMVPADMVFDLSQKNAVELTLQDGVVVMAEPEFAAQPATSDPGGARPLTLIPTTTLPANRIGEPVQIRIIQTTGWLGTGLSKLRNLFFVAAKGE